MSIHVLWHTCGCQRTTRGSRFSSATMWSQETELILSGWGAMSLPGEPRPQPRPHLPASWEGVSPPPAAYRVPIPLGNLHSAAARFLTML